MEQSDVLSILIASDVHLGYAEKDPIRGDDSFNAFEEVLALANEHAVDMLLLAGDLFHDNKPSRKAMMRCMQLLREYCLGEREVQMEIVSDPKTNFHSKCAHSTSLSPVKLVPCGARAVKLVPCGARTLLKFGIRCGAGYPDSFRIWFWFRNPAVNYEDPNYNIKLPVFSIHGNHDDPAGDGGLAALDVLSTANLVRTLRSCVSMQ